MLLCIWFLECLNIERLVAHSVPSFQDSGNAAEVSGDPTSSSSSATSAARNRLETELQQRAALLAADNANMRAAVESSNAELQALKKRIQESRTTLISCLILLLRPWGHPTPLSASIII